MRNCGFLKRALKGHIPLGKVGVTQRGRGGGTSGAENVWRSNHGILSQTIVPRTVQVMHGEAVTEAGEVRLGFPRRGRGLLLGCKALHHRRTVNQLARKPVRKSQSQSRSFHTKVCYQQAVRKFKQNVKHAAPTTVSQSDNVSLMAKALPPAKNNKL